MKNTITRFHFSGKQVVLILALLLTNCGFLRAQDIGKIEDSLVALHAKIDYWVGKESGAMDSLFDPYDSLDKSNVALL